MLYENHYWGMHLVWWIVWMSLLFWIFATPYNIPFQRMKNNNPLDILRKRYAEGLITTDEYLKRKEILG